MPKQEFVIRQFTKGMMPSMDPADLSEGAAMHTENVDPHGREGVLVGLPAEASAFHNPRLRRGAWINDGDQSDLIYIKPDGTYGTLDNWYDGIGGRTGTDVGSNAENAVIHNKDAHIARGRLNDPRWVGYQSTGASGLQDETAVLGGEVTANKPTAANLAQGVQVVDNVEVYKRENPFYKVFLKYSYLYDGYQEGPIDTFNSLVGAGVGIVFSKKVNFTTVNNDGEWTDSYQHTDENDVPTGYWIHSALIYGRDIRLVMSDQDPNPNDPATLSGDGDHPDGWNAFHNLNVAVTSFTVDITAPSSWPDRVTHLNLYVGFHQSDENAIEPDAYFRLSKTYERSDLASPVSEEITVESILGATYLASSGRPESLTEVTPRYTLSVSAGTYHMIADCALASGQEDLQNYLLRSQPLQFDSFNWPTDHIRLNLTPRAMAYFQGRLFVFADNLVYRINPYTLAVEDEMTGVNVESQDSVLVTEFGMFVADRSNVYVTDGSRLQQIGTPILNSEYEPGVSGFLDRQVNTTRLGFDPTRNLLLVSADDGSNNAIIWSLHVLSGRWDIYRPNATHLIEGMLSGPRGELFWSQHNGTSNNFVRFTGGAGTQAFVWVSPFLYMGQPYHEKAFYKLWIITDTAPDADNVRYRFTRDGAFANASFTLVSGTDDMYEAVLGSGAVSTGWTAKSQMIQLQVNGQANQKIYELGVSYRTKVRSHLTS